MENFQNFGFKSHAPVNSEVIMFNVGGNNEHSIVIGVENREVLATLPALDEGDSILYNKGGAHVQLKSENIEAKTGTLKIENDGEELVAILVDWITQAIANKNVTAIGPQPLFPADVALMEAIKARLETFKS